MSTDLPDGDGLPERQQIEDAIDSGSDRGWWPWLSEQLCDREDVSDDEYQALRQRTQARIMAEAQREINEHFELSREELRRVPKRAFENTENCRQRVLLEGMDCCINQADLFPPEEQEAEQ